MPRGSTGCSGPPLPGTSRMSRTSTGGSGSAVDALGQLEPIELGPALGTRGRRAGQIDGTGLGGAPAGDRPGVVAGIALLLVGGVVLLVDDDQAEVA